MSGAAAARDAGKRRRVMKNLLLMAASFWAGGFVTNTMIEQDAKSQSLAMNMASLPREQRTLFGNLQKLQNSPQTPETFVRTAESLLPGIRQLKATGASHHILRIQAASVLAEYYDRLDKVLTRRGVSNLQDAMDLKLSLMRRRTDMCHAYDLIDLSDMVSKQISRNLALSKLQYARLARDGWRLRNAYDELLQPVKATLQDSSDMGSDMVEDEDDEFADEWGNDEKNEDDPESSDHNNNNDEIKHPDVRFAESLRLSMHYTKAKVIAKHANLDAVIEPEIMTLFTHSPYLGEWRRFVRIGNALCDQYSAMKVQNCSHKDGVSMFDIFEIASKLRLDVSEPHGRDERELRFGEQHFRHIEVCLREGSVQIPALSSEGLPIDPNNKEQYQRYIEDGKQTDQELNRFLRKFGGKWRMLMEDQSTQEERIQDRITTMYNKDGTQPSAARKLSQDLTRMQESGVVSPGLKMLGCVQKANSLSGCVNRVQGPILNDDRLIMQGTSLLTIPNLQGLSMDSDGISNMNANSNEELNNVDKGASLAAGGMLAIQGINDGFSEQIPRLSSLPVCRMGAKEKVQQTETWDLRLNPTTNLYEGTVTIKRQFIDVMRPSVNLVFDCKIGVGEYHDYASQVQG